VAQTPLRSKEHICVAYTGLSVKSCPEKGPQVPVALCFSLLLASARASATSNPHVAQTPLRSKEHVCVSLQWLELEVFVQKNA